MVENDSLPLPKVGGGGGGIPSNRLMEMISWMESHFHHFQWSY